VGCAFLIQIGNPVRPLESVANFRESLAGHGKCH
jgi:hypothetical protein